MKNFLPVMLLLISGCATSGQTRMVEILTDPPGAAVSVNGYYVGDAPVKTKLPKRCFWVGFFNSASGRECEPVEIHAEPKSHMEKGLVTRTLRVSPNRMATDRIMLNLALEPIAPTQALEIRK